MVYLVFLSSVFSVMMLSIIKVQAVNFFTGMTTNERFSRSHTRKKHSSYRTPRNGGGAEEEYNSDSS